MTDIAKFSSVPHGKDSEEGKVWYAFAALRTWLAHKAVKAPTPPWQQPLRARQINIDVILKIKGALSSSFLHMLSQT